MQTPTLNVLALAPPDHVTGKIGSEVLMGADPASLYNACRYAALLAERREGSWGTSNWATSRKIRRQSVLLLYSLEESLEFFSKKIQSTRPNLILMGSMTLCFPGAIACAVKAKEILGDEVCIVLGGRLPSEGIYLDPKENITHHASSPLKLMADNKIPNVFDVVVSGDGEYIIAQMGELVFQCLKEKIPAANAKFKLHELQNTPGKWIVGSVQHNKILTFKSSGIPINYNELPPPCLMFGISTSFNIFDGRPTAHVFSDLSRGCIFDCDFCSERRSVTGPLMQISTSAQRLFNQLQAAERVVKEDYGSEFKASAFIEDSTILAGSKVQLLNLAQLIKKHQLDIRFGGQFTIDQINDRFDIIRQLREVGLEYLFIGIETFAPDIATNMSKNTQYQKSSWVSRTETALLKLQELNIKTAVAIVFGLGELHEHRLFLLESLANWRKTYGFPEIISLNWGVQHALNGNDGGTAYSYIEWGIPPGPFIEAFKNFGEASLLYPLANQKAPQLEEVEAINYVMEKVLSTPLGSQLPKLNTQNSTKVAT